MASDTTKNTQAEPSFEEYVDAASTFFIRGRLTALRLMGANTVDLYVGSAEKLFRVHKGILCNKVPYFDKMFRRSFQEGKSQTAIFPEDTVQSFDVLLGWVYYGKVRELKHGRENSGSLVWNWDPADAYKLADKLCLTVFKDTIVDAYVKASKLNNVLPSISFMSHTLTKLEGSNQMRQFIEQTFRYVLSKNSSIELKQWPIEALNSLLVEHPDFSHNILTLIRNNVAVTDPRFMSTCHFHCHEEGKCHVSNKQTQKDAKQQAVQRSVPSWW